MANNLLSVWSTVGSIAVAILILLVMITVHEFGHYIAGKIFKFKINEFSIGFGPAIFKKKNKKTGEMFAIRCVPLGGYCAFEGEDGLEEEPKKQENVFEEEGFSEQVQEKTKEIDPNAFTKKPCWQRIIVLISGALMNYFLALVLIVIGFACYGQTLVAIGQTATAEDGIYQAYSFQDLDILLEADGDNLYLSTDIVQAINGKKKGDLVSFTVSRAVEWQTDEAGEYVLRENGWRIATKREVMTVEIMLRADVNVKNSAEIEGAWTALGVQFDENTGVFQLASSSQTFGFWETIVRSFVYSFKIAGSILKVLGELLTGQLGISAVGGPVTTISMTSQMVANGFRYVLEMAGYIGVNLAIFNLLPIPALDGCKVVFTAIEWVRGKPISRKVEAIINVVGFIFLLGFAVIVDILQFVI